MGRIRDNRVAFEKPVFSQTPVEKVSPFWSQELKNKEQARLLPKLKALKQTLDAQQISELEPWLQKKIAEGAESAPQAENDEQKRLLQTILAKLDSLDARARDELRTQFGAEPTSYLGGNFAGRGSSLGKKGKPTVRFTTGAVTGRSSDPADGASSVASSSGPFARVQPTKARFGQR